MLVRQSFFVVLCLVVFFILFWIYAILCKNGGFSYDTTNSNLTAKIPKVQRPPRYNYDSLPFKPFCDSQHHYDKSYLAISMVATTNANGIGNRLFEIFSLIGLAKRLDRIPIVNSNDFYLMKQITLLNRTIPQIINRIQVVPIEPKSTSMYTLFHVPQTFQFHKIFECEKSKFLMLKGYLFQSFKNFKSIDSEIVSIFQAKSGRVAEIEAEVKLEDRAKFKACVHIRRADFHNSGRLQASDADFSIKAIKFLKEKHGGLVYIFSDDPSWVRKKILPSFQSDGGIYVRNKTMKKDAVNEFYFSRRWCDSVLITAPASTFGWWLAYLAKSRENIYYRDIFDTGDTLKFTSMGEDYFPRDWHKIVFEGETVIIKQ